jgi:S-adenosylmethionine hydrolase
VAGPIVLLTDFGLADAYVGTMKGVILSICPATAIVDLSHGVVPQDVAGGARLLATRYRYFPAESIFVAVVDPGVGSARRAIALKTPHGTFVAPDNGLVTGVLRDVGLPVPRAGGKVPLGPGIVAAETIDWLGVALTNRDFFLPEVSGTFHGRDVFAPVAAHLATGVPLASLGSPVRDLVVLPSPEARREGNVVTGEVVAVDHFGNAITSIPASLLDGLAQPVVVAEGHEITGIVHHYAERPGPLALIGSDGHLEVAVNGGSAAKTLGLKVGDRVVAREGG